MYLTCTIAPGQISVPPLTAARRKKFIVKYDAGNSLQTSRLALQTRTKFCEQHRSSYSYSLFGYFCVVFFHYFSNSSSSKSIKIIYSLFLWSRNVLQSVHMLSHLLFRLEKLLESHKNLPQLFSVQFKLKILILLLAFEVLQITHQLFLCR